MKHFKDRLTTFEQAEILDYPEIWYLGLEGKKIEGVPGATMNNGIRLFFLIIILKIAHKSFSIEIVVETSQ